MQFLLLWVGDRRCRQEGNLPGIEGGLAQGEGVGGSEIAWLSIWGFVGESMRMLVK